MNFTLTEINTHTLAILTSNGVVIHSAQDALDLLANAGYQGASGILMQDSQLAPAFFNLRSGLAGEVLQKFSTYDMRLAIVGDFTAYDSQALREFIRESNRVGRISFVGTEAEAYLALTKG